MTTGSEERPSSTARARASRWVLAAAVAGSALAVGSVHTITLCVVTGVLLVAAVLGWWGAEPMKARSAATLLLLTGLGLTAYTALQCVPMPVTWLAVIAPHNAEVWARALAPLRASGPGWAPISLDPAATRVEVLKGVAYLLAFITALGVARRREGVAFLSAAIVMTGLVLAAASLLHPAFGVHKLFGIYTPGPGIAERHIAPLMNPNNLAGYLNVGLCLSLAAMLAPEPRVPRPIAGALVLLFAATQVWVASRGGVVTMVLGALAVVAITRLTRARSRRAVPLLALVSGVAMVAGVVFIVLGGSDEASFELLDTNVSRIRLFTETLRVAFAMPLFGAGRGSFESVFPAFRTVPGYATYTHPENVFSQWAIEWGFPVAILALGAIAFALRPNVVLARSTTAVGAWAALVALAVQNLGDLGSGIPGLMLTAVVCAAIVAAGMPGSETRWRVERWGRWPRRVAVAAGVATAAALALVAGRGPELHDDQAALYDAATRPVSVAEMHVLARAAMLRHPAEPYLPLVTALRALHERDDGAMPWIEGSLERARVYALAHLALAHLLVTRSPAQARLEYRTTLEQAPALFPAVIDDAARAAGGYRVAMELVPEGKDGVPVLEGLAVRIEPRLPATRVLLDAEQTARAPASPGPAARAARDAVEDLEAGDAASWCTGSAREACLRDALARAARVEQLEPRACEGFAFRARAGVAAGHPGEALGDLEKAADVVSDRVPCLKELAAIARGAGDMRRVDGALDKIASAGCADEAECAADLAWVAGQHERDGNLRKALALYKRASERAPGEDAYLEHVAGLASKTGLHAESALDYERLAQKHPEDARWRRPPRRSARPPCGKR